MTILSFECQYQYPSGFKLDAHFEMQSSIAAIVGPSGTGKTTILNLIAGLLRPASGSIRLGERCLVSCSERISIPSFQRQIGYAFQDYLLFPHLTVERNLEYGMKRSSRKVVLWDDVLSTLGIGDLLHRYPGTLSGGQQQRVALGRSLLSSPQLLLLDEPLSAVDAKQRSEVLEYLGQMLKVTCIPTLIVSHDADSVARITSEVISLE